MLCGKCNSKEVEIFRDGIHGFCHRCAQMVPLVPGQEEEKQEMQIFFSYGHDNHAEFVVQLSQRIEQITDGRIRIWIDKTKIDEWTNWRQKITEGICGSYAVMAFLSKYSTRERGPCLDELAIAIASKHGMIRSVLLEPEGRIDAPAQTREYQWADMSDYRIYLDRGGDEWDKYLEEKALQIIRMLDSDEVRQYNSELQTLREKLRLPEINLELTKLDILAGKKLIGREWLRKRIDTWLDDPEGKRILLLYGKPGAGKSAFSAHLQHYNPRVAAALSCDFQSEEYSSEDSIIVWIAYKMAMRIPEYRSLLMKMIQDDNFSIGQGKDRFRRLLVKPLGDCNISGKRENMILLIDALDEASGDELMHFIRDYAGQFASWCRFLITARPEPEIRECFYGCDRIELDEMVEENNADMREYLRFRLDETLAEYGGEREEFYLRLTEAAGGVFAYAECACENVLEDVKLDPKTDLKSYPLPVGLSELFRLSLDRKNFTLPGSEEGADGYRSFWQKPLGIITASPEPIPVNTLRRMMKWGENEYYAFRQPISMLLLEKGDRITVFHLSFAEWLNTTGAGRYYSSRQDGKRNFASAAYEMYIEDRLDNFSTMYLLRFLREAEMRKEYERVKRDTALIGRVLELEEYLRRESRFQDALSLCDELERMFGDAEDEYCLYQLRNAKDKKGSNYWHLDDLVQSERYHREALLLSEKLMSIDPKRREYRLALMTDLKQVADVRFDVQDMETARRLYLESTEQVRALAGDEPDCLMHRREIASCVARYASSWTEEDPEKALELYRESQSIREELIRLEPDNLVFRLAYTVPLVRMGEILDTQGKDEEAMKMFREALLYRESMVVDYPEDPVCRSFYAEGLERMADLKIKMNASEEAQELCRRCIDIRKKLVSDYPQNLHYRRDLKLTKARWGMG